MKLIKRPAAFPSSTISLSTCPYSIDLVICLMEDVAVASAFLLVKSQVKRPSCSLHAFLDNGIVCSEVPFFWTKRFSSTHRLGCSVLAMTVGNFKSTLGQMFLNKALYRFKDQTFVHHQWLLKNISLKVEFIKTYKLWFSSPLLHYSYLNSPKISN